MKPNKFSIEVGKYNWNKRNTPYILGFPYELLPTLEDISDKLTFEFSIENRIITPKWYISELIAHKVSFYIVESISILINNSIAFFNSLIKQFLENNQTLKVVKVIDKGLVVV